MTTQSGAYTATWNALSIGQTEIGGIRERYSWQGREIRWDAVGMVPVDNLFMGNAMVLDFVCMEYDALAISTMRWPWPIPGQVPPAGGSMWTKAKPFILTGCNGSLNPLTKTYYKTILAPNFEVQLDFSGTKERMVPMRLMVFPIKYVSGGDYTVPLLPTGCTDTVYYTETLIP